jgi:hypothetical protein
LNPSIPLTTGTFNLIVKDLNRLSTLGGALQTPSGYRSIRTSSKPFDRTHKRERTCAATLPCLWIVALWRPSLEATPTNLSTPELPVNCAAQLFLPASTLSIYVDSRSCGRSGSYSAPSAHPGAAHAFPPARDSIRPLRRVSTTHVETVTPKRNSKLERSLSLAGGVRNRTALLPFGRPLTFF